MVEGGKGNKSWQTVRDIYKTADRPKWRKCWKGMDKAGGLVLVLGGERERARV